MKGILLSFLFISTAVTSSFSQQEAQTSMYLFNGLYLNPAYAGSRDALNATVMYRDQWVKIPGAPQTASVGISSPLKNDKIALGILYSFDQIGVTKTNSANVDFAYRIKAGRHKDINLSFGISAGFQNYSANLSGVATTDANDPSFVGNNQNRWLPNVGAGFYCYNNKFFAGVSAPYILANRLNGPAALFATSTSIARQYQNLLITGGYNFELGKKVHFIPSILLKYVPKYAPVTLDFNAMFVFIDRVWLGASYRLNDSYNFSLAVNLTKQVKIGYCYDLTVSPLSKFTTGTHEVMASFDTWFKDKKPVAPAQMKYF
jgi:type IX secretion system PorP/SprF family membrane protein